MLQGLFTTKHGAGCANKDALRIGCQSCVWSIRRNVDVDTKTGIKIPKEMIEMARRHYLACRNSHPTNPSKAEGTKHYAFTLSHGIDTADFVHTGTIAKPAVLTFDEQGNHTLHDEMFTDR